jgi:predicted DNA-binding antitoxin AbrB/MazE fold protein
METTIAAIYEKGLLRPLEPLGLNEGARVNIVVVDAAAAFAQLAAIAALPLEIERDETAARDHDRYLYSATKDDQP